MLCAHADRSTAMLTPLRHQRGEFQAGCGRIGVSPVTTKGFSSEFLTQAAACARVAGRICGVGAKRDGSIRAARARRLPLTDALGLGARNHAPLMRPRRPRPPQERHSPVPLGTAGLDHEPSPGPACTSGAFRNFADSCAKTTIPKSQMRHHDEPFSNGWM